MKCTYTFNSKSYETIDKLKSELSDIWDSAIAIMFSLGRDNLLLIFDKLSELKKDSNLIPYQLGRSSYSSLHGDPDIKVDDSEYFTTQTFIDSGHFTIDGEAPIFRLNTQELLKLEKEFMLSLGMSAEEADIRCENILKNDERIAKDAYDLHKIISSSRSDDNDRQFSARSLNTSFNPIYDLLGPLVRLIHKDINYNNGGSRYIKNLNLEALLRGLSLKIMGHIDNILIKPDGTISIYNLKISTQNASEWNPVKLEKYKIQLAFLKRILEFNGIDARKIRLFIVPIKLQYDDSFLNILNVSSGNPMPIDLKEYSYTFKKYDNIVSLFIDSNANIEDIDDDTIELVNQKLALMFPEGDLDIQATGIKESIKGWVKSHWKYIAKHALGKPGWEIRLPDTKESIYISDTRIGENNEMLLNILLDKSEEVLSNYSKEISVNRLVSDIQHSYERKYAFLQGNSVGFARTLLNKYFELNTQGEYKWELVNGQETLNNAGIILFKHKNTGQLDIFTASTFDLGTSIEFGGRKNLLGSYIPDLNNDRFNFKATYGNIEVMRTLLLLNEILPNLKFKYKLGLLKVVSLNSYTSKPGEEIEILNLLPIYNTAITIVNSNNLNQEVKLTNNFKLLNVDSIDPALVFILAWRDVLSPDSKINLEEIKGLKSEISQKVLIDGTIIDGLETISTIEGKILKLEVIIDRLTLIANDRGISLNPDKLIKLIHNENKEIQAIAKLFTVATRALNMYYGDLSIENEEFSLIWEYFSRPQSIPNSNVRTVGYMFLKSVNKIAGDMLSRYAPIREIIQQYYKDCGYSDAQNSIIGNQATQYENLYEKINGENTMRFKNPYDNSNDLKPHERKFLKDILWEINQVRAEMMGLSWKYTSKNDLELITKINNGSINYLNVPLQRASKATLRAKLTNFKEFGKRWMKRIMRPSEAFKEFSEDILTEDDHNARNHEISLLQAYNPYKRLESENARINYLNSKGVDYFETNLENIVIDFLEKHILCTEYSKMLTRTRGILLDLNLRGETGDNPSAVEHTVKTINDFLSVAVYNKSIMEEDSQKIESILEPLRLAVSKCYIAANPVAAVRDIIQGLLENTVRALTKFLTDIDLSDVMYGYKEVILEGPNSPTTISKLNLLNIKYRFSNLDVARISEGLKTGRTGILNADNWLYSTLRGPDYLNRMVLFSARMHHDGVDNAYYIKEGKLVYDYTLDKRFLAYVNNDTSDMKKYNEQKSLYLSLLRSFNLENGTQLVEGDPLPDAYTLQQIESFKTFADNIYGSYNKSTRAKYENTAIGRNFAVFSTWMNGIVDVYTKGRQISHSESKWEQEKNTNGELLYFDLNGNVLTLEEGGDPNLPVCKDVPIMVLGVFLTLRDAFKELYYRNWNSFKSNIWTNEIHRRNFNRILADLLVAGLLTALFKLALDPAYLDHKKQSDGKNLITNALIELTYRATSSCYDGFKGPFAVLSYFGESTNPATYSLGSKVFTDLYGFLFGEKTISDLAMGSVALPRSFRDTYKMWVRDTN